MAESPVSGTKRKRTTDSAAAKTTKSRKAAKLDGEDVKTRIVRLEDDLSDLKKRDAALIALSSIASDEQQGAKTVVLAAVSLCRGYCRMIASEEFIRSKGVSEQQFAAAKALRQSLTDFTRLLTSWIGDPDAVKENAAVTLIMRIVKEEVLHETKRHADAWQVSHFAQLVRALLQTSAAAAGRQLFVEKYVEEHDDVRYYTFVVLKKMLSATTSDADSLVTNALDILSQIEGIPQSADQLEDWYGFTPAEKHNLLSLSAHQKAARQAWMALFKLPLNETDRSTILGMLRDQLLPWFSGHLEFITDFLTDSFNSTGNNAVLALDGIYSLITERNIDYPDFYQRLYSLLDKDILHSRHRSPFLRLLDKCMASTHLPSVLVASFMKRLARLALQAPPGAVIWLVPWTYNMLRQHPNCTFMLHRAAHPAHAIYATYPTPEETGMRDPFDMEQKDPMLTHAIDSSLWELDTLMSHYHPNVATLASILGEQFTKRDYHLEDFLDHSYNTMLEGELSRELKKEPVVEWEIPKHIITMPEGELNTLGGLLQAAIDVL